MQTFSRALVGVMNKPRIMGKNGFLTVPVFKTIVLVKSLEPHRIIVYFKYFPYRGDICVANQMETLGFFSKRVNNVGARNLLLRVKKTKMIIL